MKKAGTNGFILAVALLVIAGLGYYIYLNNHASDKKETTEQSEKAKLYNYDFTENYPKTVREAVKLHCRYLKSIYNREWEEEELFVANQQIRKLMDDELLANNSEESQLKGLKEEMLLFEENKQKIISYSIAETSQIQYNTEGKNEYAKIKVTLVMKTGSSSLSGDEEYILRKDNEGKWKILGWQAVANKTTESEGAAER
ncbi:MAG: hypothetical protein NC300_08730 [Bacteroidales bacterium]|nr:hypothetical protein [Clostridium sp.]MCM1204216.1 hypothetical protein [Bacteroidales bacterium]